MKRIRQITPIILATAIATAAVAQTPAPAPQPVPAQPAAVRDGEGGLTVRDMPINEYIAVLARRAHMQYFFNPAIEKTLVSAHVNEDADPMDQITALAIQHGLTVYTKFQTVYLLDVKQVAALPRSEFVYTIKYLRGISEAAQKRLLEFVGQSLTKAGADGARPGEVRYEDKTGTLVIVDNDAAIASVKRILQRVDVPKKQVVVDVKILRVTDSRANRKGLDWSNTLGKDGLALSATAAGKLTDIFGTSPIFKSVTTSTDTTGTGTGTGTSVIADGAGIVLDPVTVKTVLRALNEAQLATLENGTIVITEDNEPASVRIVDRIPIISQTVSQTNGSNLIVADPRYSIDKEDSRDQDKSREVGLTVSVTPSILPDGTIRMDVFPRVAAVTEQVVVETGVAGITNKYPRVGEASTKATLRIPDGYSVLLGGYYQNTSSMNDNKVPLFGDVPVLKFFFRSKQREKAHANIAFLLTPTTYDPRSPEQSVAHTQRGKQHLSYSQEMESPDSYNPGQNERPALTPLVRNAIPFGKPTPKPSALSESANGTPVVTTPQERKQKALEARGGIR